MSGPQYKRVLLKLSGEALCEPGGFGIDVPAVDRLIEEIQPAVSLGVQMGIVVGGGNFVRGRSLGGNPPIQRATADHMGMLATVMNALALQDSLESAGLSARVQSAIPMTSLCETFIRRRAMEHLESGRIVILAGGTGSPFFTTDTCASLRALEINAQALLKATKVDGVFDCDPVNNPAARKYDRLTYQKVLADRLGVMDLTAISMCMESRLPIVVFDLFRKGNLLAAVKGEKVGTTIAE